MRRKQNEGDRITKTFVNWAENMQKSRKKVAEKAPKDNKNPFAGKTSKGEFDNLKGRLALAELRSATGGLQTILSSGKDKMTK